jgi:hypothetical protein
VSRRLTLAAASLCIALPLVAADSTPRVAVELDNGRVLRAIRADREGDAYFILLPAGRMNLPASRVRAVRPLSTAETQQPHRTPGFTADDGAARDQVPPGAQGGGLAEEVQELVQAGRWDAARDRIRLHLVQHPNDHGARIMEGQVLVMQGRFQEALAPLRSVGSVPANFRRARDLALSEALSGLDRVDEAIRALDGTPEDGRGTVAAARERLRRDLAGSVELLDHSTTHFVIHVPADVGRPDLRPLERALESVHEELVTRLGAAPHERIQVVLHPGTEFWEVTDMTRQVRGLYDGKVRVPAGRLDPVSPVLVRVLRHEVAHAFAENLSRGRLSRVWHEGIAEHFSGRSVSAHEARLAAGLASRPEDWPPSFSHPTAHARVAWFVRRFGERSLRDLLAAVALHGTIDGALRSIVGLDSRELDAEWARDLTSGRGR